MVAPQQFLKYIDDNKDPFIKRLGNAIEIQSVSGDATKRTEVVKMAHWLEAQLKQYGVTTELRPLGSQNLDGKTIELPPAILGRIGDDPKKKTVLVYGHFDVQPASKSDGWNTEPFELYVDEKGQKLYGRGSTDDKGPILGWLNVLEAHHTLKLDLPVNMVFCFEGMEESGSEGLDDLIASEAKKGKQGWFGNVDCVCISDNYWLNTRTPCLTYGLRGIAYYEITVTGPGADLHSGIYGGAVYEPMTALISVMSKLVGIDGRILIPGIYDDVPAVTSAEVQRYEDTDYAVSDLNSAAGGDVANSDSKVDILMARSRNPSLSLHGIAGAFSGAGAKTVIPATVSGKFSIRLVPNQDLGDITKKVTKYIKEEFDLLGTKNTVKVDFLHGGKPWAADPTHWNYEAARRATQAVYLKDPNFTREGGSIPVTLTFADNLHVNVLLLPMGRADDGAHSTNEKIDISNFIEGSKLLGTYLYELADPSST